MPARVALALCVALSITLVTDTHAGAQEISRAAGVRSLEVIDTGVTVRAGPSTHAPRRGTVRMGTFLPVEARVSGLGCASWYRIGVDQFICEDLVSPSAEPPHGDSLPVVPPGELLGRRYAFVSADGTWAYSRPSDYFLDEMVESLGRGFGLVVTEQREEQGVTFFRSQRGVWVPADVVRFARGSPFEGVELAEGRLDVAWVSRPSAELRAWNGRSAGRVIRRLGRRDVVHVVEEVGRGLYLRTEEGVVRARDVIRTTSDLVPAEVHDGERWIDVDLTTQTLVAYEGTRPVFATLVSTGRSGPGHETPVGVHRIWVKLAEDTMDDLDRTDAESNYAIEGVPWVQYFAEGVGLHAAFWHDDFGRPRSHGCVNLSPRDARRLFGWTTPDLPPGWDAILTTESQLGTIVRVRGRASRR